MGYIYFIEMKRPHLIKIGYASDVGGRLSNLQTASPFDLSIFDMCPGTKEDERFLQRMFKPHRYRREWFRPADQILDFIEDFEEYRRETFERTMFDPETHKTEADIHHAIDEVPITGFLLGKRNG